MLPYHGTRYSISAQVKMEEVREIWLQVNRPSVERFTLVLRRRGIANPPRLREEVRRFATYNAREVFRRPNVKKGKIFSVDKDSRWSASIIDYTRNPSAGEKTYRYVLFVQDLFTRFAWGEPMHFRGEAPAAFSRTLTRAAEHHTPPDLLTIDKDTVFKGIAFQRVLDDSNIAHVFKASREDSSTMDRL